MYLECTYSHDVLPFTCGVIKFQGLLDLAAFGATGLWLLVCCNVCNLWSCLILLNFSRIVFVSSYSAEWHGSSGIKAMDTGHCKKDRQSLRFLNLYYGLTVRFPMLTDLWASYCLWEEAWAGLHLPCTCLASSWSDSIKRVLSSEPTRMDGHAQQQQQHGKCGDLWTLLSQEENVG